MTAEWSTPECPFVIEYSLGALESIRIAVADAFFSVPRGGAEIGGILLGEWEKGRLTVSGYKALDCEHAFGPSFTLSPSDRAQLTQLIAAVKSSDGQVVGWYHSHTRSQIFLSEADRGIHNDFFPEPTQVALVLRPDTFVPTRAGFFFRDAAGSMRSESSHLEFTVEPLAPKPAPDATAGLASVSPTAEAVVEAPSNPREPDPLPSPQSHSREAIPADPLPRFLEPKPLSPRRWPKVVIPLVVGVVFCAAAFWKRDLWFPRVMAATRAVPQPAAFPPLAPGLNTVDFDGQLQIRWNPNSPAVAQATDGVLRVKGGAPSADEIALDRDHLLSGIFTIARQSERVDVSLQLNQPAGQAVREVTSFIGKLPGGKSTRQEGYAAQPEQDDLAKEVTKVKADLDAEIQRNRKMQKAVDFLAKQLHDQQRARLLNQAPDKN